MADDPTGGMGDLAAGTAKDVDSMLSAKEAQMLLDTSATLKSLRPEIADRRSFDKLLQAVGAATANNESAAQLQERVVTLGTTVIAVAKKVAALV